MTSKLEKQIIQETMEFVTRQDKLGRTTTKEDIDTFIEFKCKKSE